MSLVYNNREQYIDYFERNLPASIHERTGIIQRVMSQEPAQITFSAEPPITSENIIEWMAEAIDSIQQTESRIHELIAEAATNIVLEEEPTPPVVKQRAPRKVKEKPLFWKETMTGGLTEFPLRISKRINSFDSITSGNSYAIDSQFHLTSPNVRLIPLKYVLNCDWIHESEFRYIENNINNRIVSRDIQAARDITGMGTGLSNLLTGLISSNRVDSLRHSSFRSIFNNSINNYMRTDLLLEMCVNSQAEWGAFDDAPRLFQTSGRIDGRTFSVNLGGLSCFMSHGRNNSAYTPQVMAVVLPENYIYQKEYLLTHGKVDLSKVIFLVNRELDSTSFPQKNFRAFYRKHILPIIKSLNVDVWHVPTSFIEENCFHNKITLESKSFMDKKKEIECLYEEFTSRYLPESLDEDDEEIDEEYDEDDE